jgi:hypothetical protein
LENFENPNAATEIFYDISPFAGQNVDLELLVGSITKFDSVAFVVPEPLSLKATSTVTALPTWYLNI